MLKPLSLVRVLGSKLGGARFFGPLTKLVAVTHVATHPSLLVLEVALPKIPLQSSHRARLRVEEVESVDSSHWELYVLLLGQQHELSRLRIGEFGFSKDLCNHNSYMADTLIDQS